MSSANDKIGIVVLAAGMSSRLGSPKQLLTYNGKSLLKHAVDEAAGLNTDCVVVVLGANAEACRSEIQGNKAVIADNKEWQEGMASSLITGLKAILQKSNNVDGVIFMVCDQPFVTSDVLSDLINRYRETGKCIVASHYGEAVGTPAFFHRSLFDELMQLKGDEGARKIIQRYNDKMTTISFPGGSIDIDRKEDYESLTER